MAKNGQALTNGGQVRMALLCIHCTCVCDTDLWVMEKFLFFHKFVTTVSPSVLLFILRSDDQDINLVWHILQPTDKYIILFCKKEENIVFVYC